MSRTPLHDRQAITDLIHVYCRSVDRLDVPLGHGIWHEDATADYGASFYQGPGKAVIDKICDSHRGLLAHSHQIANILVTLDGDRAGSEAYCTATLRMQRDEAVMQMSVWSRYVDRWSFREGRWGLDHRIAIRDFDEVRTVTPMSQPDMGSRDASDPSYGIFAPGN
ncbi:nuclear transport factor 2 family protein [Sphingobium sufflavum]|uniref:nuclear transport factor 2 family protein n=1 Tax=Sphingobium sufflavum TaxID=1129547 RepID=UPI001F3D24D3|nr:nuclear transport factor 2 family protein [Sphingobium sufflavum]MCE7796634.1 nuclear transport factor 2 family protein [Sphingobium sufflavum]